MAKSDIDDETEWVYTKKIRLRDGRIIYAAQYGLKAFRFRKSNKYQNPKG